MFRRKISLKRIMCLVACLMLFATMMPMQSYATESLVKDGYGFWCFDPEDDYDFTFSCSSGKTYTIWNDSLNYSIDYVENDSTDILTVSEVEDYCFDIKTKKAGTAYLYVYGSGEIEEYYDEELDDYVTDYFDEELIAIITVKVKPGSRTVKLASKLYMNTTKIKVKVTNVQKGDVVKLKIGKKTYSKKITKKASKKTLTFKIRKPKSCGIKYKLSITNSKKKSVATKSGYVYSCKKIRKGLTKKQVKWIPSWGSASDTASASGGWSYWYYDDGSYIGFKKGKVNYWYDAAG